MIKAYCERTREELLVEKASLEKAYQDQLDKELKLDMSRGKPSPAQLDLSMGMMDVLSSDSDLRCESGEDCRSYGVLEGIEETKRILSDLIEIPEQNILIYGNSSLNLMFDTVSRCMTHGVLGSTPWCKLDKVKFLAPVPGYDRHFAICEYFGIEMIPVPLKEDGPDMDIVEELLAQDDSIKGIWCVPKYANPTGCVYSDTVIRRFARLKPAARDFRIFWDNAYGIHHLYDNYQPQLLEIFHEAKRHGNEDIVFKFTSTSKISFPGSGIAAFGASDANIAQAKKHMMYQTIGHDKVNQLRHARFFKNFKGLQTHMKKHASIVRPKFEVVETILTRELSGLGIGTWSEPKGGYFVSFDSNEGCAAKIIKLCAKAGLKMTEAGATYPYHNDPTDSNIRIAPTFPSVTEVKEAMELFTLCVKLVSINKILGE